MVSKDGIWLVSPDVGSTLVTSSFVALCIFTGLVMFLTREAASGDSQPKAGTDFRTFQRQYIIVYVLAMFSDWLQGPYVYALYASYGFSPRDNAVLFVAGFGSSMVFGTVVGSMADSTGRKRAALIYTFLYIASCLTKHVSSFAMLMVGRITGGIATSLLFSVFESWLVCEHNARGFQPDLLGETFGLATFSNSIVAITAGLVAELAADALPLTPPAGPTPSIHYGGYCSPFDLAILTLFCCTVAVVKLWKENFGEQSEGGGMTSQVQNLKSAAHTIVSTPKVLYCGVVAAFFESSMFIFVFQWTPAVTVEGQAKPPYGNIFATFMVACMLGSRIFSYASKKLSVERIGQATLVVALLAHLTPVVSGSPRMCFVAFLLFELCVGVYFPMMGTMKGKTVPEGSRTTIYNLFRVPLNFTVVTSLLLNLNKFSAFLLTSTLIGSAFVAQTLLLKTTERESGQAAQEAAGERSQITGVELEPLPSTFGVPEGEYNTAGEDKPV